MQKAPDGAVVFLLNSVQAVFDVIGKYYPSNTLPTKTQFLVEEVLEDNGTDEKQL